MRNLIPWMHLHDDFWKYLIIQLLPPRIGLILLRYTSKYSSDQIAHMADILHHKYSAPSDIRPTVIDVISGRTFVIDSGCSISFIPPTANERRTLAPGKWVKMSQGGGLVKYGQKKLTVDFDLGYFMPWNFAIMECTEAVIGADFLAYYDLLISTRRKLTKGRVMPNPSSDKIYKRIYRRNNRVLYITDRISGMEFLVDSGAYLSQIPRNSNSILEPIPIYRFVKPNGFPIREYGYKYLIVDLGMKETFPWNFLITNNDIPLIAADFLRHFDLCIDLRRRKLIKGEFVNIPK
ncbi:unnamed protein product [Hymenolepis diminuta]|uniref:Peptidase A2 domain-containing protein n=1 Tax=Hymenolepis diminuta TaxID=6216 RepID=A0A564XZV0_HYMDI|nr:unnamed protein product [Hymenolepis diminuta]